MPEYLLSVHATAEEETEQASADPASMERLYAQVEVFNQRLRDTGAWVYANGLQPSRTATVVDASGGSVSVVPGSRGTASHRLLLDRPGRKPTGGAGSRGRSECRLRGTRRGSPVPDRAAGPRLMLAGLGGCPGPAP